MPLPARLHASPRRDAPVDVDAGTGEVRVPLSLYSLDEHQGDIELVLSRGEGAALLDRLAAYLHPRPQAVG
ncbi:hypothetical protein GCM10010349_78520 [Streptomyces flavofungini]|nr:hypothetical protein GCM10010349_78520 [Streptomyces flavofungini]